MWRCRELDMGFALVNDEGADSQSVLGWKNWKMRWIRGHDARTKARMSI